jgi:hypothetical protein
VRGPAVTIGVICLLACQALPSMAAPSKAQDVCALVIDWLSQRDRVMKIIEDLENGGVAASFILLPQGGVDARDVRSVAAIVFSARPALLAMHLSSFSPRTEALQEDAEALQEEAERVNFGTFFAQLERAGQNAVPPFSPRYVVYTRASISPSEIGRRADIPTETFADRTEIVPLAGLSTSAGLLAIKSSLPEAGELECADD